MTQLNSQLTLVPLITSVWLGDCSVMSEKKKMSTCYKLVLDALMEGNKL